MRLATLRGGARDGRLVVVDASGARYTNADDLVPHLQAALDDWDAVAPALEARASALACGDAPSHTLDFTELAAPLPRAYEWVDGSAFLNHVRLVRRARGASPPPTLETDPLVYQGGSGVLLGPRDDIVLPCDAWGLDFESEVCVVLGDVPVGTRAEAAEPFIRLVLLANDVTYRNLIPGELKKGFGFFCSKPATAFSPFAVTPSELGSAWRHGRLHRRLRTTYNGEIVGDPDAGPQMHFSFFELVEHITRTRAFTAGTILGSGTISNEDRARGVSCLAERRMLEIIETGDPKTGFMKAGDEVSIEMLDDEGRNIFGTITQRVVSP